MDSSEIRKKVGVLLQDSQSVSFAYLFGSRATGHSQVSSDYDIAIYPTDSYVICSDPLEKLALLNKLQADLELAIGSDKIDLIDLSIATPLLRFKIIKNGLLISEKDRSFRVAKVSRWIMEYLDIKPFLEYRNRIALKNLRRSTDVA